MKHTPVNLLLLLSLSGLISQAQLPAAEASKIQRSVDQLNIQSTDPGLSVLVMKNGIPLYTQFVGLANCKNHQRIQADTRFNLGSITKQFTAAAIYQLEENHLLRTTDSIQQYLPELPSFEKPITIQHLLTHSSGIPDHLEILGMFQNFRRARVEWTYTKNYLAHNNWLMFNPGEEFAYSNTGYMILAEIIHRISGMPYEQYLEEHIFKPHRLSSFQCSFNENKQITGGLESYRRKAKRYKRIHRPYPNALGATGIYGTLQDLANWNLAVMNASKGYLSKLKEMQTDNHHHALHYGGGLILKKFKGHLVMEHSGGWNEFLIQCRSYPKEKITVIVAANSSSHNVFSLCDEICGLLVPSSSEGQRMHSRNTGSATSIPTGVYVSSRFVFRHLGEHQDTVFFQSAAPAYRTLEILHLLPSATKETLTFIDQHKDTLHVHGDGNLSYSGGHYFPWHRTYTPIDSLNWKSFSMGKKYRTVFGNHTVRIKHRKRGMKIRTSFLFCNNLIYLGHPRGHGPLFKIKNTEMFAQFEGSQLLLGNNWVDGVCLEKIKGR